MVQFYLLQTNTPPPTPHPHHHYQHNQRICLFSCMAVYSLPTAINAERENSPPPGLLINHTYFVLITILISIANQDVL